MNWLQRIRKRVSGILLIAAGALFIILPDIKYMLLLAGLGIYLLIYGARMMIYYFTMARLMVGGRAILYKSVILLDLAMVTVSMTSFSPMYLIIYLVGVYAAAGVIDILRGLEAKKLDAPEWKMKFASGLFNIVIAGAAGVSGIALRSADISEYIFGGGLIWSGVTNIADAFRRTRIVYIQ